MIDNLDDVDRLERLVSGEQARARARDPRRAPPTPTPPWPPASEDRSSAWPRPTRRGLIERLAARTALRLRRAARPHRLADPRRSRRSAGPSRRSPRSASSPSTTSAAGSARATPTPTARRAWPSTSTRSSAPPARTSPSTARLIVEPGRSLVAPRRRDALLGRHRQARRAHLRRGRRRHGRQPRGRRSTASASRPRDRRPRARGGEPVDLVGRHCESGDVARRPASRCATPRASATWSPCRPPAPTASRWQQLQRRAPPARGVRAATATRGSRCGARGSSDLLRLDV